MITWKAIKYKHFLAAQELFRKIEAEEATDHDVLVYAVSLIAEWDFVDAETGELLPISEASLDELSLPQYKEIFRVFNAEFAVKVMEEAQVPKVNAGRSRSSSTRSKAAKRPA